MADKRIILSHGAAMTMALAALAPRAMATAPRIARTKPKRFKKKPQRRTSERDKKQYRIKGARP